MAPSYPPTANADEVQFAESIDARTWIHESDVRDVDVDVLVETSSLTTEMLRLADEFELDLKRPVDVENRLEQDKNPIYRFTHRDRGY